MTYMTFGHDRSPDVTLIGSERVVPDEGLVVDSGVEDAVGGKVEGGWGSLISVVNHTTLASQSFNKIRLGGHDCLERE